MLPAGSRTWLAGNPGPPPSPATITLIFVVLALGLALAVVAAVPRRHREAPLREETGTRRAVTFQAPVRVLHGGAGLPVAQRGSFRLVIRRDLIEVANSFRPARSSASSTATAPRTRRSRSSPGSGTTGSRSTASRPGRPLSSGSGSRA